MDLPLFQVVHSTLCRCGYFRDVVLDPLLLFLRRPANWAYPPRRVATPGWGQTSHEDQDLRHHGPSTQKYLLEQLFHTPCRTGKTTHAVCFNQSSTTLPTAIHLPTSLQSTLATVITLTAALLVHVGGFIPAPAGTFYPLFTATYVGVQWA